jgi:hypothetical protein
MTMNSNKFIFIMLLFNLMAVCGCVTTTIIYPEDLPIYADKDIVVTTTDGRVIRFDKHDYTVDTAAVELRLMGRGREYTSENRSQTKSVTDSISLKDIALVEVRQKTVFYYTGPIVFLSLASVVLLFGILWWAAGGGGLG